MNRNDGAVGDARKARVEAAVGADRDEALDVAAEHIWHNIESGLWWTHKPLADWIAADRAKAKAEALREAVDKFRSVHAGADMPTDQGRKVFVDALQMGTFLDWLEATR